MSAEEMAPGAYRGVMGLRAKGVAFSDEPKSIGPTKFADFDDTCGNLIRLVERLVASVAWMERGAIRVSSAEQSGLRISLRSSGLLVPLPRPFVAIRDSSRRCHMGG
jgi:hypothetical protein